MSEQVIDRATLEKKDKGELTTIVNALGGKATSRMKKSDLVDLIIERSGAVVAESEDSRSTEGSEGTLFESGDKPDPSGSGRPTADGAASEARSARPPGRNDRTDADRQQTDRSQTERQGGRQQNERQPGDRQGSRQQSERSQSERPTTSDRGPATDRTSGDSAKAERSDSDRGQKQQGGDQPSGSQQSGNQQSGNQQSGSQQPGNQQSGPNGGGQQSGNQQAKTDDTESGNRRRRRRGRGRDRDDMIEPVTNEPVDVAGILDLRDDGYGFMRVDGLLPSKDDVYVPVKLVRQFGLRRGDLVTGTARPANRNEKNPALSDVESVNGRQADDLGDRDEFDRLTPVFPDAMMRLERSSEPEAVTSRILDLVAPIGRGQRMLVVAPPRSGKTTLIKEMARSIERNQPDVELVVLLIDERPEDVTDMAEHLEHGDVVASTFDRPADEHCSVAELTLERAKRMVEDGTDVVIILDGLTDLARAYNLTGPGTGRTLAGGLDAGAIYPVKHFFGSARNVDEGGSLTVIATVTVETGSAMDDAIFGEFNGTANAQIRLDRLIAERAIFPAIDVVNSGTRNAQMLVDDSEYARLDRLRSVLIGLTADENGPAVAAASMLSERVAAFATNQDFLNEIA